MKKFFQIIGLISLMSFSFFYTEKTVNIVKELDDLMVEIKEDKDNYYIKPLDAIIKDNTVIPGLSGREVDIDKSYETIKKVGKYSNHLLSFKSIKPNISYINNYDKYIISGNENNKNITLLFKVNDNDNINTVKNILDKEKIKASFFVTSDYFDNNQDIIYLINDNYNIGNYSQDMKYDNKFKWMNTVIKKVGKQNNTYCYVEKNNDILNKCMIDKSYTIKPNIIINTNPLIEVKKNLTNGSIISFNIDNNTIKELPLVIKYIKSKGYNIINLSEFLKE